MLKKEQVENKYNEILAKYIDNLQKYSVKMPRLYNNKKFTINALVLVYLYHNLGNKVTKVELTSFLRNMGYEVNDVQQARHLAQQSGWYIISGTRGDSECKKFGIKTGEYLLKTIYEPYPSYKNMKRSETLNINSWEQLKKVYKYRCATCGSKEGKANYLYSASITQLQQGHKDPNKALTIDNTIPQCTFCNKTSRDYFVFDNKGRVEKICDPHFILRSDKEIQIAMFKLLIESDMDLFTKIFKEYE